MLREMLVSLSFGMGGSHAPPMPPLPPNRWAPPAIEVRHGHHHFHVMYRECNHDPWRCYGEFESRRQAERQASRLRQRGFEVYVRSR